MLNNLGRAALAAKDLSSLSLFISYPYLIYSSDPSLEKDMRPGC